MSFNRYATHPLKSRTNKTYIQVYINGLTCSHVCKANTLGVKCAYF